MGVPMMVDSDWLQAVDAFVRARSNDAPPPVNAADSRFYDVRPAILKTAWKWSTDAKCYRCKMSFLVNGEGATLQYDCYAPSFAYSPGPTVNFESANPRVYVVWRGRWEVVSAFEPTKYAGGTAIDVTDDNVINNLGVTQVDVSGVGAITGLVTLDPRSFVAVDSFPNCAQLRYSSELRGVGLIKITDKTNNALTAGASAQPETYQEIAFYGIPVTVNGAAPEDGPETIQSINFAVSSSGSSLPSSSVVLSTVRRSAVGNAGYLAVSQTMLYVKSADVVTNVTYNANTGLIGLEKATITYLSLTS